MRITGGLRVTGGLSIGPNTGGATLPVLRWDPSFLGGGGALALSNNNTTVVDLGPGNFTAIATNSIPLTGAYMFTVRLDYDYDSQVPTQGAWVGVGTKSMNRNTYVGGDNNSFGFSDDGNVYYNDSQIDSGFGSYVTPNSVIDIAVLNNTYIWIRINGGHWNQNASSNLLDGTGGLSNLGGIGFTKLYPMVTCGGDVGPTQFTLLPTSPYGVPSGVTFFNQYTPPPASGVTINLSDLTSYTSGPLSGNSYVNSGGWDYVVFTQPALYNAFVSMIGGTSFVPLAVQWSAGSDVTNGFVFIEFSGNPNEFQFVTTTDSSASTPQSGTFNFPATFNLVV